MKFLFVHGYRSSSKMNFWPWLKDELRKKGHEVIAPDLPGGENPDPDEWIQVLLEALPMVDDETIVIGHSLGGPTALRYLEAAEVKSTPRGCLLIGPVWRVKNEIFNGFFLSELDFDVLMWKASKYVVLHDKEDDRVPFDHGEKYAKVLSARLVETTGNKHFKDKPEYPDILNAAQELIDAEIEYDPGQGLEDEYDGIN